MGAIWTQQGSLRISPEQGLAEGESLIKGNEYTFEKDGHRLFMIDTPIELITIEWQVIARIIVSEFTVGHNKTKGIYKVLKVYSPEETKVVSGTIIPFDKIR